MLFDYASNVPPIHPVDTRLAIRSPWPIVICLDGRVCLAWTLQPTCLQLSLISPPIRPLSPRGNYHVTPVHYPRSAVVTV